jgi:hypothetical protein
MATTDLAPVSVLADLGELVIADAAEMAAITEITTQVLSVAAAPVDATNYDSARALVGNARAKLKAIETAREAVKRPVLDLGKRIDTLAKAASEPLKHALDALMQRMNDHEKVLAAEAARVRAEAEAKARREREEAEAAAAKARAEAAEAERQRLAAIADGNAERAAEEARRVDEARAAQAAAAQAQVDAAAAAAAAKVAATPPAKATREVTRWWVEYTNTALVPRHLCVPDDKLVLEALKAGEIIPGAELKYDVKAVSTGRA